MRQYKYKYFHREGKVHFSTLFVIEHEFLGKAVIKANCSERLQVATEFPNMASYLIRLIFYFIK